MRSATATFSRCAEALREIIPSAAGSGTIIVPSAAGRQLSLPQREAVW